MISLRTFVPRITRPGQLRFQVSGLQKPGFLHSLYSKQTAAYKKPAEESLLTVDLLLGQSLALTLRPSRKEVFQPHLPVRLPCYDLAPITSFALGRSLRSRTSGTPGFHGLTGGVYKARERIHRSMADLRLLANPTSWSRVADSNPDWDWLWRFAPSHDIASYYTSHCSTPVALDVRAVLI